MAPGEGRLFTQWTLHPETLYHHPEHFTLMSSSPSKVREYCPRCNRAGDDLGRCGNFAIGCPPFLPIEPGKVVTLRCAPCNITRAIPAADLMQGRCPLSCQGDTRECKAVAIHIPPAK